MTPQSWHLHRARKRDPRQRAGPSSARSSPEKTPAENGCEKGFSHQQTPAENGCEKGFSHQQTENGCEKGFSCQRTENGREKGSSHQRAWLGLIVVVAAVTTFIWRTRWAENPLSAPCVETREGIPAENGCEKGFSHQQQKEAPVSPPAESRSHKGAITPDAAAFAASIVQAIQRQGHITVTVHVALADQRVPGIPAEFADGDDPSSNLYWGALYGVETHLANAAGWRRAYSDQGTGGGVVRRVVFHRQAEVAANWQSRGVTRPFDIYLLANAWPPSQTVAAMEQPLRDALTDDQAVLQVDGVDLTFGGGSVMTGYVGPNRMADRYWDPFEGLAPTARGRRMGVFYICSMSAVYLHQPVVDHGLYSVLFARQAIVPEAYILEGVLQALAAGELDEGFVAAAAAQYARYQRAVPMDQARFLFYR